MTPSSTTLLPLVTLVLKLLVRHTNGYNVRPNCAPYIGDIEDAVLDFTDAAHRTQILFQFPRPQPDISNLRETLFQGLDFEDETPIGTGYSAVNSLYRDIGLLNNVLIEFDEVTTTFTCAPSTFSIVVDASGKELWYDTDTRLFFDIVPDNNVWAHDHIVVCPPGRKTRLGFNSVNKLAIIILCAEVLTQTDGQPKMFVGINGVELSHNDRPTQTTFPNDYQNKPPENVTQNAFSWPGMSIDQLRQRLLSAYIGRNIITILGISRILAEPRPPVISWVFPTIRSRLAYSYFDACSRLTWDRAIRNVDSYSILITGYYFSLAQAEENLWDPPARPYATWWRADGTLWWV